MRKPDIESGAMSPINGLRAGLRKERQSGVHCTTNVVPCCDQSKRPGIAVGPCEYGCRSGKLRRDLPNSGGDHESRKFIARKLRRAARRGDTTLGALESVARHALEDLMRRKIA